MIKEATAMTVRQNLGELLNGIQYGHDQIVITKGGKPVAAMVDCALFERIRRMQVRFDTLSRRVETAYAEVPEADGMAEIDAAVTAIRAGK